MVAIESILDAVTVHASGAVCTRLATVPAHAATSVTVTGLPLLIAPDSLRARADDAPNLVRDVKALLDVEHRDEDDIPALVREIEAKELAREELEDDLKRLDARISMLENLGPVFLPQEEGAPPRPPAGHAIADLARFADGRLEPLHAERLELADRLEDVADELDDLRFRVATASTTTVQKDRTALRNCAVVTLDRPPDAPTTLAVEYVVPVALWRPAYELDLARGMDSGRLRMRALVAQATGEDWDGVELTLSTAALSRRFDAPELKSLRIGRRQPAPARSGWREPPDGLEGLFADYDAAVAARPSPPPEAPEAFEEPQEPAGFDEAPTGDFDIVAQAAPAGAPMPQAFAAPAPPRPTGDEVARAMSAGGGSRRRAQRMPAGGVDSAAPEPAPEPAGVDASDDLLDYQRLVLAAPAGARRGRLVRRDPTVAAQSAHQAITAPAPEHTAPPRDEADVFDYRYAVEARASVPSDGSWHSIAVTTADVGIDAEYVTVPSVEPKAFRTVRLANRSPHALLAGPVDVRCGEEFLLTAPLPTLAPQGSRRLGLGVEEAIKVARNTSFEEGTTKVLGVGSTVLRHGIEIEVANRLAVPATVDVRERVPVTQPGERDVKIEETQVDPPWRAPEPTPPDPPVDGERSWRVTLRPGETATLRAGYEIRIPGNKMLEGGNRRT